MFVDSYIIWLVQGKIWNWLEARTPKLIGGSGLNFLSNSGIESYGLRIRIMGAPKFVFQYPKQYEILSLHWYSTDVWPAANGKWCCWSFTQWTKILANWCSMMMFPKLGTHGILVGAAVYQYWMLGRILANAWKTATMKQINSFAGVDNVWPPKSDARPWRTETNNNYKDPWMEVRVIK